MFLELVIVVDERFQDKVKDSSNKDRHLLQWCKRSKCTMHTWIIYYRSSGHEERGAFLVIVKQRVIIIVVRLKGVQGGKTTQSKDKCDGEDNLMSVV